MENLLFLGVPILKHFRVILLLKKCTAKALHMPSAKNGCVFAYSEFENITITVMVLNSQFKFYFKMMKLK